MFIRLVGDVSNATVQFYRYGFYGCSMFFYVLATERSNTWKKFRQLSYIGIVAALIFGASNLLFTAAIQHIAVGTVLVIVASNPMFAAIFSWFILGERVPIRTIVTSLVCFGCIAYIFASQLHGSNQSQVIGLVCAILASATLGLYFVLARCGSLSGIDMVPCNAVSGIAAALVALAIGAAPGDIPSTRDAVLLCVQGLIEIPVSFTLLTIGPSLISAPEVSLYMLIETVIGPVWVWLAGFEQPPMNTVYGGAVLLFALMVHSVLALRDSQEQPRDGEGAEGEATAGSSAGKSNEADYEPVDLDYAESVPSDDVPVRKSTEMSTVTIAQPISTQTTGELQPYAIVYNEDTLPQCQLFCSI